MDGFWITFGLLSIIITAWESTAITNKRRPQHQEDIVRDFRHIAGPSSTNVHTDWEVGLREATNQALLREGYQEPNLRDRILEAPLIGRQDTATPFGDIAVLARGQLYVAHGGNFVFVQDPYQNDCDDCHNVRSRCIRSQCEVWKQHQNEYLVALWTVKRLRHHDYNNRHRYELEYTVSPISAAISEGFVTRNGHFDYAIPGHVFVVKNDDANQPTEPHPTIIYNRKIPHRHFKPEVLIGVSPDGRKHILHSYPGFYTSFPVHPTYHQQGYSTNDPKEIELYKALIESLAAKTSTTKKVENGPHRFSLNQYGGIPQPNKVYSTKPSYDSFLSPKTPLVQLSTGQVVPLTEITSPATSTTTNVPVKFPTEVYRPDKPTKPVIFNMVPTNPTVLNTQEVYPHTEGFSPPTEPEVTQPIKTTFHYFTPVEEHLLTTDDVKHMKMTLQTTVTPKKTTEEYHKPTTPKSITIPVKDEEADFLFPIVEKSTSPSKTTTKYNKPTSTAETDLYFLFPIEQVTATSKVTNKYHATISAMVDTPQLSSTTHKISTPRSTTIETSSKSPTSGITTPTTTTLEITTPKSTPEIKTTMAKSTKSVIITTKTPVIIKLKTNTTRVTRPTTTIITTTPKSTTTKTTTPKTTTTRVTTSKLITTKVTTPKSTRSKITTSKSTTIEATTSKSTTIIANVTTPKFFTVETTTPKSTTYASTTPSTITTKLNIQKSTVKITTPKQLTPKITTTKPFSIKITKPIPTSTNITTSKPSTTKITTPKLSRIKTTTSIPISTKIRELNLTTTGITTQIPTVTYPATNFIQPMLQQVETEELDYSLFSEVVPTKPMKATMFRPVEPRPESINQLQAPATDADVTVPFSITMPATQKTQESTRNDVKTTNAEVTSQPILTPDMTLKTSITSTTPSTEETASSIFTKITQSLTDVDEETTENVTKITEPITTQKQTDSTTTVTMSLPPTLKYSTSTQQYTETIKTPEATRTTENTSTKIITTIKTEDTHSIPTLAYETTSQYTKPITTTKMWQTSRSKPVSTIADDFLKDKGKMQKPNYTKPMNTDYDEDDIFGSTRTETKPTKATTRRIIESELAGELFGDRKRSSKQFKTDTTPELGTQIIYANFFDASTTPLAQINEEMDTMVVPTKVYDTTLEFKPLTSQSYSTSISFEVNKKNKTNLLDNGDYEPTIMATVSEVMKDNVDYTVYKAELPTETTSLTTKSARSDDTRKAFDEVALQLVNHARSIDYLSMNNRNRTSRSKYKRRRNYIPKSRRTNVKRKKL